ncbi:MAG: sigma-70 family RNA polymerase sigma factor [Planctomycetia bacterium]|nr:sigma-70 family RNA polymerase sigma factor [Planctomycetia bacterium]
MTLEPDAIVQVLLRERLRVTALAASVVRDVHAADDIFQQVVLSALESRSQFHDVGHVLAWSLRAARHRAIDLARSRQLRPLPDEVLDLLESRSGDPAGTHWSDRDEALHHCMSLLAPAARGLLQMKYGEGLTAAAIATRLQRSSDAVYQSLSRIHRCLRECVERQMTGVEKPVREGTS